MFTVCKQQGYMYTKKPKEMGSQLMICGLVYCLNAKKMEPRPYMDHAASIAKSQKQSNTYAYACDHEICYIADIDPTHADLHHLMILLKDLIPVWSMLGTYLIEYTELMIIIKEQSADSTMALLQVLNQWIRGGNAAWPQLVIAIQSIGGYDDLARRIAEMYSCTGALNTFIIKVQCIPLSRL